MTVRRLIDGRLLLALLHPHRPTAQDALEGALASGGETDWAWLQDRAMAHKVAPLVSSRLLSCSARDRLPAAVATRAAVDLDDSRDRTDRARATLQAIAASFAARAIDFLLVKGSVLAESLYESPWQRRFYDVDLVVRPEHVSVAEEALVTLGYEFVAPTRLFAALGVSKPASPIEAETFVREFSARHHFEHHYRPRRGDSRLHVDLHWRLLPAAFGAPDDLEPWESAVPATVAGIDVLTLDEETTLLHQALHAMRDRPASLRIQPLVDFAWMLARSVDEQRRRSLLRRAREWRAEGHVLRALELVAALFPGVLCPLTRSRPGLRGRIFAPLVDPTRVLDYPGISARESRWSAVLRLGSDTLRWRMGAGDLARTARMKAAERMTALSWGRRARSNGSTRIVAGEAEST